ncbi:hypothetical protein [Marinomonas algicola]|uniref:hypothetical protein n=1 Tax=Marinomonas algicola TaxID=2773454 RepID=UPI00174BCFB0|nr:hypothetical protein [Marinomonas algicola]
MAAKPKSSTSKKKQPAASETSASIESQMEAFLASGGKIDVIESGVSGQVSVAGPKHITLNKKS